jgi:glycosyltransferase involved in cell wall biosynthesis
MFMARILIDARALADERSGGVGRAARFWITFNIEHSTSFSVILSEVSPRTESKDLARAIKPDPSTSLHSAQDDNSTLHEFICVTTGLKPSRAVQEFCETHHFKYLHLRIPNKLWTMLSILRLVSLSRAAEKRVGKIDLVLLPNLGFVGPLHRPYHLLIHDLSFLIEPRWFTLRRRWWHRLIPIKRLVEGADKLDCVSEQTRQDALRIFKLDKNKTSVIPPMDFGLPDVESLRPNWLPNSVQRFVLLLGGSDPRKNIHTALRAVATYNIQHTTLPLIPIVLGGQVKCRLNQCPLSHVKAPGHVSDAELKYLYQNATAMLYPSWYEGFGLPLHEAYHLGTPIIASSAGALPETAPPGTVFCHPAKPQEWLMALETLTTS